MKEMNIWITKCDHCGKIIDSNNDEYKVEAEASLSGSNSYIEFPTYYEEMDLCDNCLKELREYVINFLGNK